MKDLFITCPYGFEELLQKELLTLGVSKVSLGFCGVLVPKDMKNVFLINYESRIATRVLWPIIEFFCFHFSYFEYCRKNYPISHPVLFSWENNQ